MAAVAPSDTVALEALLPDHWIATHPEHRLEQREENPARPRLAVAARESLDVRLPSLGRR